MASHVRPITHHYHESAHVRILGLPISDFSKHLLRDIAGQAHLQNVQITSVHRSVTDQARIFYNKHIVEGKEANYKNPEVAKIVAHARTLHKGGEAPEKVKAYLINAIEHVHGGRASISMHIGVHIFTEVFDVAHYSGPTKGSARHNYMTNEQANAFLAACRRCMPHTITRLGHSSELGFVLPTEFQDEKCFHFEVKQPVFDKLEQTPTTMIA
jgi:hypothetical protein